MTIRTPMTWTRIIPADAGSTGWCCSMAHPYRDHPRRCGEHVSVACYISCNQGSSPQMRGAPGASMRAGPRRGIIPADAGSTAKEASRMPICQDHPRRCGEHPDVTP